jgi:hypothetical protein
LTVTACGRGAPNHTISGTGGGAFHSFRECWSKGLDFNNLVT